MSQTPKIPKTDPGILSSTTYNGPVLKAPPNTGPVTKSSTRTSPVLKASPTAETYVSKTSLVVNDTYGKNYPDAPNPAINYDPAVIGTTGVTIVKSNIYVLPGNVVGTPGGNNTQLQFNSNGSFGGISTVTWNGNTLNLGNVANISITGGEPDYVLTTDGSGNLSWTAQTGGNSNIYVDANGMAHFSGNVLLGTHTDEDSVLWAPDTSEYMGIWWGGEIANLWAPNVGVIVGGRSEDDGAGSSPNYADTNLVQIFVRPDAFTNANSWFFFGNGAMQFPDQTIQTTAYTGNGGGGGGGNGTFDTVTANNLVFSGTGPININSGNDLNLSATGQITMNSEPIITLTTLQAVVANSINFADFQAQIANL